MLQHRLLISPSLPLSSAADGASALGTSLEELCRHSPELRPDIIDLALEALRTLAKMGGAAVPPPPAADGQPSEAPQPMDADVAPALAEGAEGLPYLVEGVAYTARMLQGLFSHTATAE